MSTTRVNSRDADRLVLAQVRLLRTLLAPMPRIGEVNLAQIVAEVGPILERVDTAEQAIAECGAAPVTRASSKTKTWVPLGRHRAEQRLTV